MTVKIQKNKIVIKDFINYWKTETSKGHKFVFAHGKDFDSTKPFTIEVEHSDKIRSKDGRWSPIKS